MAIALSPSFVLIHFVQTFPKRPLNLVPIIAEDDASVKVDIYHCPQPVNGGFAVIQKADLKGVSPPFSGIFALIRMSAYGYTRTKWPQRNEVRF